MKQQIDRNRIKEDLLAKNPKRKQKEAIENNDFYVVEDICLDDLHRHGEKNWFLFKLSGRVSISNNSLLVPSVSYQWEVERYLNSQSWQNKRMYLVFSKSINGCIGIYSCDECRILDNELYKKAIPDSIVQNIQKGIISLQLFSTLTIPKQNKFDNNKYSIHRHICVNKHYSFTSYDGDSSTDYQIVLSNSEMNVTIRFSDYGSTGIIGPNGVECKSGSEAFSQILVNGFYYVGFVNDKPKYIFSAEHWQLSTEFNLIPKPQPKPAARQGYLQEIKPLIDRGIIREIYGNDTVSILNLADSYYAITDYRKDVKEVTQYVSVLCDHSVVKMFFKHPKELPLIMATIRKVRLQSRLYDQLTTLSYHTQEVGPDDRIDLQMEKDIKELYPGDIFEALPEPHFSKNDWLNGWN